MSHGRRNVRRAFSVECMETRLLLSGGKAHAANHPSSAHHRPVAPDVFTAILSPKNVALPYDQGNPAGTGASAGESQIQGGGGASLYPTPIPGDPAKGKVVFTIADGGSEIKVTGTLVHISNVTAVTVHDTNNSAAFALRGTTTSPATEPPALQPNSPALAASTTTVTTSTTIKPSSSSQSGSTLTNTAASQYASTSTSAPSPVTTTTTTTTVISPPVTLPSGSTEQTTDTSATATAAPTPAGTSAPTPAAPTTGAPIYYAADTVNTAQSTQTGQVLSSNTDQTVALLLNPGTGSGPVPPDATFQTVIRPQYLLGPLARRGGFAQLIKDMRAGDLYVLVQTNDGYDQAAVQQDGDYPFGELRGTVERGH
jgi:hypothetical protein